MSNHDHDHDHDHDRDSDHAHANDNGNGEHQRPGSKIAPAPAGGGALASIASLAAALANVPIGIGRTGLPMMIFKSRENSGTWGFGQRRTIPEAGSRWAVNPLTIQWGCISFGGGNKVVGERLVPITQPKPLIADMPDTTFPWGEEWSVNMKCLDGADAGVEVIFKATTDGAIKAIELLVDELRNRLSGNQHNGKIVPIALLEKDSYQHSKHGPTAIPVLTIVDWMSLDGPAPASAPVEPTPPVDQPRRRRVA
jgi:hypothetical protein